MGAPVLSSFRNSQQFLDVKLKSRKQAGATSYILLWHAQATMICFLALSHCDAETLAKAPAIAKPDLEPRAREQIRLLHEEKLSRTPAQQKMGSQLLYLLRQKRQGAVAPGLDAFRPNLRTETDGRVLVDLRANVSPSLIQFMKANGALVVNSFERYGAIRALAPAELTERLAQRADVRSIRPAARATTNIAAPSEGGDIAHRAAEARQSFFTDGTGVKIGVLSDSVDGLADAQANGVLPAVTILPGQGGTGTGEGTAMLEIVHALAPGAQLYFATAFNSEESFAQNIRDLQTTGCQILIDDVTYFDESPFQDGPIAQAVNEVTAAGALYFSASGNSGGEDRGTSGTWEGDFKDAGASSIGQGGRIHDFGGGITYNTVLAGVGFERLDLTWSDPLGHSTNDYDVYILDASGNVVTSSTDNQSGSTDPYESVQSLNVGQRIVILQYAGTGRFLHLSTGRGRLTFSTAGTTYGHNACAASNAFCVAATRVASPPTPFTGGAANPVEAFSSDGPRRIFYNPDGTEITPGNLSSTGGTILQKPDITAADGVYTSLSGFAPFFGTSAAAPHAGAIAALLWSYNPFLPPSAVRSLLMTNTLSAGNAGFDRNSGFGIVMAYPALAAAPRAVLQNAQLQDANHNNQLDADECADLILTLHNPTAQPLTGITAVLTSSTSDVFVDPVPRAFPDLQPNQTAVSTVPFHLSTGPGFVCGSNAILRLQVMTSSLGNFLQPFQLPSGTSGPGIANTFVPSDVPMAIPDLGMEESGIQVSGIVLPLAQVRVSTYIKHTYDQDLRITIVAPDGTEVLLSANNGQSGQNYGAGCQSMTRFSDAAVTSITAASAPFVGDFAPESPLSAFQGKTGDAVNGLWKLRVEDQALGDVGTLQCWSLELTPIGCQDGGGQCLSPPVFTKDLSDQSATNGTSIQLQVGANGTGQLFYQWYFNVTNALPQQTNTTLVLTNVSAAQAGVYQVVVTNVYGSSTSAPANLVILLPAKILTGPADQVATNGNSVTWNVIADGTGPFSYQWYFNLTNTLASATNSSLVLSNVSPSQAGTYEVVVANAYGSVTSTPAKLLIFVPPTIVCGTNMTVALGSVWSFTAPTFSDPTLVLSILGTTTNALCGNGYTATRQWLVSAPNGYQVGCSQSVQVLDTTPPVINCPADKTNVFGTSWSFDSPTARDAGGIEALVYDNWTNALGQSLDSGQTEVGNQITLSGPQRYPSRFAFEYWGTNANQATFAGSVTAQVRFYQNDGPTLSTGETTPGTLLYDSGSFPISATKKGALMLQDFQMNAAQPLQGNLPSSFTWTVRFSGLTSGDAAGLNLFGPPVVGQAAPKYWALGQNGWTLTTGNNFGAQLAAVGGGATLSLLTTVTNALCGQSFKATRTWQAVDGCNNTNTCSQTVTVVDHSAPLILTQPQDQSTFSGRKVSLSVNVSSCPPTSYQWYFNVTNAVPQGTSATLVLNNVTTGQAGSYQLTITNAYGTTISAPAILTVVPVPTIINNPTDQEVTNGDSVQWTVVAQGSGPLSYQWFFNNTNALSGQTNAGLTLNNVTGSQAGDYTVMVSDSNGSTVSAPARLKVLFFPTMVSVQSAFAIPDPGTLNSKLRVTGFNGILARVVVKAYITHTFDADLLISLVSPDGTQVVLSDSNGQGGHNYGADCNNTTVFSDSATNSIELASAPFVGEFKPQQSFASFIGKSGTAVNSFWTLQVQDQSAGDSGTLQCWSLELDPQGCLVNGPCLSAPEIIQDLSDQTAVAGTTVNLSVSVQGAAPLSYQWYFNGTNLLQDATGATLTLNSIGTAQAGTYQVVVTNPLGSATGILATLNVIDPARILSNPGDQTATNGDTVTWSVVTQGALPLSFQWYFNLTNAVANATNSALVLSNVTPAQSGTYELVVSNVFASVTSAPAKLLVRLLPRIICSPDTNVTLGDHWDFTSPIYTDTNLIVNVVGTTTNVLCGRSYSATRQWLVSDTNGYHVTCQQTVQVLDTEPPVISCPADKTNHYGSNWTFDSPTARSAGAVENLVYDNWTNSLGQRLDPGQSEAGNQVTLSGLERYPSRFTIEYWGTNANNTTFAGTVTAQVRFYQNDGPALPTGEATPGSIIYDSGPLVINATNKGALTLQDFQLSAAQPLQEALPSSFTWTVRFSGLGNQDAAGLNLYGPPVVGQVAAKYWALGQNGWILKTGNGFGGQLAALSQGTSLSVLMTVTNALCGQGFKATRTWQAFDSCNNSNSCSQTVTITDQSKPLVLIQPQDQVVLAGQTVSVPVSVSSCPPTSYQWYFNVTNAVTGETNNALVLATVGSGQAGAYAVVISNAYGSITSAPATITVHVPALIAGNPVDQTVTNGDDVHWRVLAKGTPPLFYQWYFNGTNALGPQTDSTLDLTNVNPTQAGTYQVVVTNLYGSFTSTPANLTIVVPPVIVTNPVDQVANNGDTVTWSVLARGTDPLLFHWYFNSTILSLNTNSILVLSNVSPAQAGSYEVVVANAYGSATSAPAKLKIVIVPRVVCSPDKTVSPGSTWDFDPPTYNDLNLKLSLVGTTTNSLCGDSYSATRQWVVSDTNGNQFPCSQTVKILDTTPPIMSCPADKTNVLGTSWKFDLPTARDASAVEALVYDNWTNALGQSLDPGQTEVGNQITLSGSQRYPSRFAFEYWGTNANQAAFAGSVTAQVRFYQNDGPILPTGEATPRTLLYDSGPLPINATTKRALTLEDFQLSAAQPLQGALPSSFTWTVRFSGLAGGDAAGLNLYGPPVVGQAAAKYWVLSQNGWTIKAGDNFGSQLAALSRGANLSVLTTVTNTPCGQGFKATRTWQALDACSNSNTCSQTVTVVDQSPPLVLSQPQNQSALVGQTVSLSVGISSCPPTSYQWYFNVTNTMTQGTNATLVLNNVTIDQAGSYEVVIINTYGSVTSAPAVLSISGAPTILSQPQDVFTSVGSTATFTISASGAPPPSYQWLFNDTNILVGAKSPTLSLVNVQSIQAGLYSVKVSNTGGSVTSTDARLSLGQPPVITLQPQGLTNFQGQAASFTVAATGTAPLTYQWMANCTRPISGATSTNLRLKNSAPTDSGTYCVTVSNLFGIVSSQPAVLRVLVQPKLISLTQNQTGASLSFATTPNLFYSVYWSVIVSATNWTLLPNAFQLQGTGAPMTVQDPGATGARQFYKIVTE
jgi:subtilisin-like proprotein convertase family protein